MQKENNAPLHHRVQLIVALAAMMWLLIFMALANAETVTIKTDGGGDLIAYMAKANEYAKVGSKIEIRGSCASACTVFLKLANTCVAREAWLGFHQTRSTNPQPEQVRLSYDQLLWRQYPAVVQAKLGTLQPDLVWLRGADLIPAIPECH